MKSRLLMIALTVLLVCGTTAYAQDPNLPDTIDLELTVDTVGLTAQLEVWVFSDEALVGATMGIRWDNSATSLSMDTAIASSAVSGFDLGVFLYEGNSRATTNTNMRFLFGGASLFGSVAADATGRRLWATYDFTLASWAGDGSDGIEFDTLTYSGGTEYLFVHETGDHLPIYTGKVTFGGSGTAVGDDSDNLPTSYSLAQNYPNPFNPTTEIAFDLPSKSKVRLTVFNILGQEVTTLVNKELGPGHHSIQWDGGTQASGIYFYKLEANNFSETRKMMLVK